jgi:hypothetical protein
MTNNDSREADALLEIEYMLNADQRRPLSVAGHHAFREGLRATDSIDDDIDSLVEDIRHAEFEGKGSR